MISPFITFNKIFYEMPKIKAIFFKKIFIKYKKAQLNISQVGEKFIHIIKWKILFKKLKALVQEENKLRQNKK